MCKFEITDKYLLPEEIRIFNSYLNHHNLDESIWDVSVQLFNDPTRLY